MYVAAAARSFFHPEGKQIEEDSIWRLSHNSCCYNTPNAHKHKLRIGYTMSNPIEDQVDDIFFFHYIGTIYQYDAPTATRHKKLKSLKIIQFFCEYGLLLARPIVCTDRMRLLLYLGVQFR